MCWYSPSANIKEPIKKPQINYWALHEGFFNAKYSDLMKFAIMWENNSDVYGLDQFKEFVWPYWVEYYFTDSRYYTVDNRSSSPSGAIRISAKPSAIPMRAQKPPSTS